MWHMLREQPRLFEVRYVLDFKFHCKLEVGATSCIVLYDTSFNVERDMKRSV